MVLLHHVFLSEYKLFLHAWNSLVTHHMYPITKLVEICIRPWALSVQKSSNKLKLNLVSDEDE